jgi:hypothetical protein
MWLMIKENFRVFYETLVYGLFGLLPAFFFAGVIGGVLVLLGMLDKVNEIFYYMYAGACGGYWLGNKFALIKLERTSNDLTKIDINRKSEKD